MFGKGVHQEEEVLLRDIIRSINKKIDYTAREGEGTRFTLHLKLRGHETDVALDLEDLELAKRGYGQAPSNTPENQGTLRSPGQVALWRGHSRAQTRKTLARIAKTRAQHTAAGFWPVT